MDIDNAYKLIMDKLTVWMKDLVRILPNIALAALILVLGLFIAKYLRNFIRSLFRRVIKNETLDNLFSSLIYIFLIGIVIFIALSVLKLDKAVTSILAGAGILGLALAFAFQDIAANFMSGMFLSVRKPLSVGDIVKIKDYMGRVEEINLRDTVVRTFQGQFVIIPNKDVFQNSIENFTTLGKRRIDLTVGISYGEDLEQVKAVTMEAVQGLESVSQNDAVTMFYTEFADSSINFIIRFWVESTEQINFLEAKSEAIIAIKKTYDAHNIMIPFPIRTLDFGIKGGVSLNEMQTPAPDRP